jgi:RNA polymerase sporulation-specific sigma factor
MDSAAAGPPAGFLNSPAATTALLDLWDALEVGEAEGRGVPLPLAPDFAEVMSQVRDVLTVSETAAITGVKERQVHHWAAGTHNPQGAARERLLALHQILGQLRIGLNADRAKVWLWSHQARLSGSRPYDLLVEGNLAEVLAAAREIWIREEPRDESLVRFAREGNAEAYHRLVRRYHGLVRSKASSYFLIGGDAEDLIQEGLVGLYKAVRDYRTDTQSSFRNFAELCITRQIITTVKTATHTQHAPLNESISLSAARSDPRGVDEPDLTLEEVLPLSSATDPANQAISSEELRSLVASLSAVLSALETSVLSLYLDGYSYDAIGEQLDRDRKTVDNALQRVRRKIRAELTARKARGLDQDPRPPRLEP